jgi:hypothetical protein
MDCHDATTAIVERSLGALDPDREAALLVHLEGCPVCAAKAGAEADLGAALALLRTEPPFEVDVANRVLEAIAAIPPPRRDAVAARQFGWAALAAAGLTVGILVSGAFLAPSMIGLAREAGRWTLGAGGGVARLGAAAFATLASAKPLLGAAWDLLTAASLLVRKAEPLLRAASAVTVLAILILTTAVIGRDFRARAPADRR